MKKGIWFLLIGVVFASFAFGVQAADKKSKSKTVSKASTAETSKPSEVIAEPPAAFTFESDEHMQDFVKLAAQRQSALTKMAVLQSYIKHEEMVVAEATQKLQENYKVDVTKNYYLDGKRKALIEREMPQAATTAPVSNQIWNPQAASEQGSQSSQ